MDQPPLSSPLAEQAHDKLRGYGYQCWLSVEAWLALNDGEVLFIEAAEDFATFREDGSANVSQAKALAESVSLRSKGVLEAINHYWHLHESAPTAGIKYCFLTTADIATENKSPFDKAGLKLWRQVSVDGDYASADTLRKFLVEDTSTRSLLSKSFLEFASSATPDSFLRRVIRPIVWDTCRDDSVGVRATVESQISVVLEREHGESSSHAPNVADSLFTRIYTVASRKEKEPQNRATLHKAISDHLKPSQLAASLERFKSMSSGMFGGSSPLPSWNISDVVPPLVVPEQFSARSVATKDLRKAFEAAGGILIEGSTGMGKSTLAQLLAENVGGPWLHVRCQGEDPHRAVRAIQECSYVAARAQGTGFIIDDFPWESVDAGARNTVAGFARTLRAASGRVIFTNQRRPTATVLDAVGFGRLRLETAPAMLATEIEELLLRSGCSDQELATSWSKLIAVQTAGHPQLAHAEVIAVRERNWPAVSTETFVETMEVLSETRNQQTLLLRKLSPDAIQLLTRLSVFFGTFTKTHAVEMGARLQKLVGVSVLFETLRGPWIEAVAGGEFKLSPLIGSSLVAGVGAQEQSAMHRAVVDSVLSCKPLEARHATSALINAVQARSGNHVSKLVISFLQVPRASASSFYSLLSWSLMLKEERPFTDYPAANFLFAVLRLQVAANIAPDECERIQSICDSILKTFDEETQAGLRSIWAFAVIGCDSTGIPLPRLFEALDVVRKAVDEGLREKIITGNVALPDEFNAATPSEAVEVGVVLEIWDRIRLGVHLAEMLQWLAGLDAEARVVRLQTLMRTPMLVVSAFDRPWLAEEKGKRDWDPLISLYQHAYALGASWDCQLIQAVAVRCLVIITNEYLDDEAGALKIASKFDFTDPVSKSLVAEQRGKIEFLAKRYSTAHKFFEEAIPSSPWKGFALGGAISIYENAANSAARDGNWSRCAELYLEASELAVDDVDVVRSFSNLADAAYALFESGDRTGCTQKLREALRRMPELPNAVSDASSKRAQKMFGHLLTHLAWGGGRSGEKEMGPVYPGMCSDAKMDGNLAELPLAPMEMLEMMFLRLELYYAVDLSYFDSECVRLKSKSMPMLTLFVVEVELIRALRKRRFVELPKLACELAANISASKDAGVESTNTLVATGDPKVAKYTLSSVYPIQALLVCGLSIVVATGQDPMLTIRGWHEEAKGLLVEAELTTFLKKIEDVFSGDLYTAGVAAANESNDDMRWTAALRLLLEKEIEPVTLLVATLSFVLPDWDVKKLPWLGEVFAALDPYLSGKWKLACTQREHFKNPTLFIPDIRELASIPDGTVGHLAKICSAAAPALDIKIAPGVYAKIATRVNT